MSTEDIAALEARVYAYKGRECGCSTAADAVNKPMIRQWCEVMGNTNPDHLDEDRAASGNRGELVAPATMLFVWNQAGYSVASKGRPKDPQVELIDLFNAHGYLGVVATDTTQEYYRELRLGDTITARTVIDNISPRKSTGLGEGYFYETITDFSDQDGNLVGRQTFKVLKFKPKAGAGEGTQ
ncbi:FAS1-like dehydratase domain-containing protein [Kineobactrum sediminis]|nr:MaoC family dehydratase N-terminal domain-containing protein [Kineobactrum sediminis]